ncbi:hypothetical protein KZ829_38105 [Actinoplanes hulinensis]|uniref:Acetyltransferase n=1 Tax=Actinoplanes hulinensis TaxID=1144547 RepID=A0ABS7BF88_9ACTN|nr:hypothetical protein [Actinoplanes hulinensis]MBW6439556.1 hypothetical protein [Actinoplanes hulinensis]
MTIRSQPTIRTATPADQQTISELLAEAFLHGDLADWLIPHLDTRARIYPHYFALHVEHALTHGYIDMTADGSSVVSETIIRAQGLNAPSISVATNRGTSRRDPR